MKVSSHALIPFIYSTLTILLLLEQEFRQAINISSEAWLANNSAEKDFQAPFETNKNEKGISYKS